MTVTVATSTDLDWILALLARRRRSLVEYAPLFWQPAPDARNNHRAFLDHLLTEGGARAYRTDQSVLIATPRGAGWLVDDAHIDTQPWAPGDGRDLWNAFAADCHGSEVRFVCPAYEPVRADFARGAGLTCAESWWLAELTDSGGGRAGAQITVPGADAITVAAPPVYAPPGPVLFLPAPTDVTLALPAALTTARELGCAAVVVNVPHGDDDSAGSLMNAGFRRHCDYFTGTVHSI